MNRFRLILIGALAILMAGCSKDNPREPEKEPWVNDLSLPVPIELGVSSFNFTTRTKADMLDESNVHTADFWVYAVDTTYRLSVGENETTLMANEKANLVEGKMKFAGDKTWYYPYASAYNYTFYAYHVGVKPGTSEPPIQFTDEALLVKLNLNDIQSDVLWARSVAKDITNGGTHLKGFNARYIRKAKQLYAAAADNYKDHYAKNFPKLEFQHLTTALEFNFLVSPDADHQVDLNKVKVTKLELSNMPSDVVLCVASRNPSRKAGEIVVSTYGGHPPVSMNCDTLVMEAVGNTTKLGTLFVHVPADSTQVLVDMAVQVPRTSDVNDTYEVPVKLTLGEPEGGFKPGYKYSYTIQMNTITTIEINGSVKAFEPGETGSNTVVTPGGTTTNDPGDNTLIID